MRQFIVLFLYFFVFGCSGEEKSLNQPKKIDNPVPVVTINEMNYSKEDVLNYLFYSVSEMDNVSLHDDNIKKVLLDDFINHKLILNEAIKEGITVDLDKVRMIIDKIETKNSHDKIRWPYKDIFEKIIYEHLVVQSYLNKQISKNIKVDESEIKQHYETFKKEFKQKKLYNIYQIFNTDEKLAYEAREELYKRNSFEKVARKYSMDAYAEAGGNMGFVDLEELPDVFKNVKSMKKGKISKVIKSEYGYHIFYLKDIDKGVTNPSLEDVSGEIYSSIYEKKQQIYINNLIKELREDAKIIIDSDFTFNGVSDDTGKSN